MTRKLLITLTSLAALLLSSVALASTGFSDAPSDAANGGGEITGASVIAGDGTFTIDLDLGNRAMLVATDSVSVYLDTDRSSSTGNIGFDYRVRAWGSGDAGMDRWTSDGWETASGANVSYSNGVLGATIQRDAVGGSSGFGFFGVTFADGQLADRMPDSGTFAYPAPAPTPTQPTPPANEPGAGNGQPPLGGTESGEIGSGSPGFSGALGSGGDGTVAVPGQLLIELVQALAPKLGGNPILDGNEIPASEHGVIGKPKKPSKSAKSPATMKPRFSVGRSIVSGSVVRLTGFRVKVPRNTIVTFIVAGKREAQVAVGGPVRSALLAAGLRPGTVFTVKATKAGSEGYTLQLRVLPKGAGVAAISVS